MSRWRKRILATGILLAAFLLVAYFFSGLFLPASASPRKIRVEIPMNASTGTIAEILAARGLIRSPQAFVVSARVLGLAGQMKAGDYELDAHHGLLEILDQISRGEGAVANWVTIPEGLTTQQTAALLEERRMANARVFMELCQGEARRLRNVEIPRPSLEGYLLPDSYKFKAGVREEDILQLILTNFERKVLRELGPAIRASGRSMDEILIVASLIEREAKVAWDREKISAVIRNRLQRRMPLQIDATVLYALGQHRSRLTTRDTRVDHPYNTYRHRGLPPGPICNPGIACIRAALAPADEPYLYYVVQTDGSHHFSTTYREHQQHGGT